MFIAFLDYNVSQILKMGGGVHLPSHTLPWLYHYFSAYFFPLLELHLLILFAFHSLCLIYTWWGCKTSAWCWESNHRCVLAKHNAANSNFARRIVIWTRADTLPNIRGGGGEPIVLVKKNRLFLLSSNKRSSFQLMEPKCRPQSQELELWWRISVFSVAELMSLKRKLLEEIFRFI